MKTTPFDPERRVGTVTQVMPEAVFVNLDVSDAARAKGRTIRWLYDARESNQMMRLPVTWRRAQKRR